MQISAVILIQTNDYSHISIMYYKNMKHREKKTSANFLDI